MGLSASTPEITLPIPESPTKSSQDDALPSPTPRRGGKSTQLPISPGLQARMVELAREFRKEPTPSEGILWEMVRGKAPGARFRRQQPIGPFVVDFFCPESRLIVEVDGAIHAAQADRDRERQSLLEACGYHVLRLSASEVERSPRAALERIRGVMRPHRLTLSPLDEESAGNPAPTQSKSVEEPYHLNTTTPDQPTKRSTAPLSPRGRGDGGEGQR